MQQFNITHLKQILPDHEAVTLFIALRRYNLGKPIMSTVTGGNRYVSNIKAIRPVITFNVDECINLFKERMKKAHKNPERQPNPMWISKWNTTIKNLNKIKELK